MTYDAFYQTYISVYKPDLRPNTLESYEQLHRLHLSPVLGALELDAITPEDVQIAINNTTARAGSRQAQLAYTLVRSVLSRATRSRRISWNPCDAIDKPRHIADHGRAITDADLAQVLPWIKDDIGIMLALCAGLRRGEVCGLKWGDIDLRARCIHVSRSRGRTGAACADAPTKSASGVRDVPLLSPLYELIRDQYQLRPSVHIVQCAPESLSRRWSAAQIAAGLTSHYRFHDLRHTFATRCVKADLSLKSLQVLLGHSAISVTADIYTHITPADAVSDALRIASIV